MREKQDGLSDKVGYVEGSLVVDGADWTFQWRSGLAGVSFALLQLYDYTNSISQTSQMYLYYNYKE